MSKIDHSLFAADAHALEHAYGNCPKCGSSLAIKHGKSGPFIGCSQYPQCDYSKPLHEHEDSVVKVMDDAPCPKCSSSLAVKKGRFGLFIGCTNFPQCHYIQPVKEKQDTHVTCPSCNKGKLIKRSNRFGKHFFACDQYPSCKYVVNFSPLAKPCPKCDWPIMLQRVSGEKTYLQCPQRQCQHREPVTEE